MALVLSGSIDISGSMTATTIIVSAPGAPGMVSSSNQLVELNTATGSLIGITNGLTAYTASLKGAIEVSGQNVNVLGTLTAQEIYTTYVTSSILFKSGSTKFGDDTSDKHEFTGSLTARLGTNENLNIFSLGSGDMRVSATNDAADTTVQLSIQGSPLIFRSAGGVDVMRMTSGSLNVGGLATSANYKLGVSGSAYINGANNKGVFITDNATYGSIVGLNSAISAYNPLELRASGTDYQLYLPTTGEVLMGSNSVGAQNSGAITFRTTTATYGGVIIMNHSTTNNTGAGYLDCYYNTSYIGGIQQNGASNVAFNTSSDYRLKEDLKDFNGLNLISNLKVYDFKWKTDNTRMYGVLAHELQEIIPYVVNGNKDEVKEDGKIKVQVVDYSKIVPILIKSIQEQQDIIEELKARIEALENK
jgi:hypothetical protein